MNRKEAAKLLELIKLSYPNAYRGMEDKWMVATINMWTCSFPDVPYPIIEQAFNHYRMTAKFPPTVAEMVEELKGIYYEALEGASVHKALGSREMVSCYQEIMSYTHRYAKGEVGIMNIDNLMPQLNGGVFNERLGTSRDNLGFENRLPFLEAGEGGA